MSLRKPLDSVLCLDVATRCTGCALFQEDGHLITWGNLNAKTGDLFCRANSMLWGAGELLDSGVGFIDTLVLEYPSFQGGSVRGGMAVMRGDTLKLAYVCGALAHNLRVNDVELVTYAQWNGQLTKDITCRRLKEKLGIIANPKTKDNNWADAIMMGVWWFRQRGVECSYEKH